MSTATTLKVGGRFKALWAYRAFVLGMVARDFRGRYLGSVLNTSWAVLNPLAQIVIYTLIFSHVMRARLPNVQDPLADSLYLCAGAPACSPGTTSSRCSFAARRCSSSRPTC
jgi:ABC-type polysaccharide/polyol phosphate export permease